MFGKEKFKVAGELVTEPGLDVNTTVEFVKSPSAPDSSIENWFDSFKLDSGEKTKVVL